MSGHRRRAPSVPGGPVAPARYCGDMAPRPPEGELTVYIDDACAMCVCAARRVARADRHRRLRLRTLAEGQGSFPREDLARQLHAVDARGQVFLGYDALVAIAARATRFGWLAPFLGSPPARWAGRRCYALVAGRRRRDCGVRPRPAR